MSTNPSIQGDPARAYRIRGGGLRWVDRGSIGFLVTAPETSGPFTGAILSLDKKTFVGRRTFLLRRIGQLQIPL